MDSGLFLFSFQIIYVIIGFPELKRLKKLYFHRCSRLPPDI